MWSGGRSPDGPPVGTRGRLSPSGMEDRAGAQRGRSGHARERGKWSAGDTRSWGTNPGPMAGAGRDGAAAFPGAVLGPGAGSEGTVGVPPEVVLEAPALGGSWGLPTGVGLGAPAVGGSWGFPTAAPPAVGVLGPADSHSVVGGGAGAAVVGSQASPGAQYASRRWGGTCRL